MLPQAYLLNRIWQYGKNIHTHFLKHTHLVFRNHCSINCLIIYVYLKIKCEQLPVWEASGDGVAISGRALLQMKCFDFHIVHYKSIFTFDILFALIHLFSIEQNIWYFLYNTIYHLSVIIYMDADHGHICVTNRKLYNIGEISSFVYWNIELGVGFCIINICKVSIYSSVDLPRW